MQIRLTEKAFLAKATVLDEKDAALEKPLESKDAVNTALINITNLLREWGINSGLTAHEVEALNYFKDKFIIGDLGDVWLKQNYENSVMMLQKIYAQLKNNPYILSNQKITIFKNLLNQLQNACPPGKYISIQEITEQLNKQVGIRNWLAQYRLHIVSELIANEMQAKRHHDTAEGMQAHIRKTCLKFAEDEGYHLPKDATEIEDRHQTELTADEKEFFKKLFSENYHLRNIINTLVIDFSEYVYDKIVFYKNQNNNSNTYHEFTNFIEGLFRLINGNIPMDSIITSDETNINIQCSNCTIYILSKNTFQSVVRPFILAMLFNEEFCKSQNSEEHKLDNSDIFHLNNDSQEFSWIETKENNIIGYDEYIKNDKLANQIPAQIHRRILVAELIHLEKKLDDLIENYSRQVDLLTGWRAYRNLLDTLPGLRAGMAISFIVKLETSVLALVLDFSSIAKNVFRRINHAMNGIRPDIASFFSLVLTISLAIPILFYMFPFIKLYNAISSGIKIRKLNRHRLTPLVAIKSAIQDYKTQKITANILQNNLQQNKTHVAEYKDSSRADIESNLTNFLLNCEVHIGKIKATHPVPIQQIPTQNNVVASKQKPRHSLGFFARAENPQQENIELLQRHNPRLN